MKVDIPVEKLLREYKVNKARISFLECQMNRFNSGMLPDYMQAICCSGGNEGGDIPVTSLDREKQGWVMEANSAYSLSEEGQSFSFCTAANKEITTLKYLVGVVEDALMTLGEIDQRYRIMVERFYIEGCRMDSISECLHVSRSRCYELCKESVNCVAAIIYGTGLYRNDYSTLREERQVLYV